MSYDFKDLFHDVQMYHIAYETLRPHPKFMFQRTSSTTSLTVSDTANDDVDSLAVEGQGDDSNAANVSASNSEVTSAALSAVDSDKQEKVEVPSGRAMGRKAAIRQLDAGALAKANMENVRNIAKSLQLKAELEEEKNGMKMISSLSCESEQGEKNKTRYFLTMRQRYLHPARDRESTEKNFGVDGSC